MSKDILILVGPTRTSTTSLFRYLSSLNEFLPSKVKETNFFIHNDVDSVAKYVELFEKGDGVLLEASPLYFLHDLLLPKRIKQLRELGYSVKVVITLRDPVERFWSLYKHIITKRSQGKHPLIEDFVKSNIDAVNLSAESCDIDFLSLSESCYSNKINSWVKNLGAENIRITFFENLTDPKLFSLEMQEMFKWLNLDVPAEFSDMLFENKSTLVKRKGLHKFALKVNDNLEPVLNRFPFVRSIARNIYYSYNAKEEADIIDESLTRLVENACVQGNYNVVNNLNGLLFSKELPAWVDRYR